jgi:hypothetical protein
VIRFVVHQYRYACRTGFGRSKALKRAISAYKNGF